MNTELINDLTEQYNIFQEEIEQFNDKGVGAAGTRARKALLEIENLQKKFVSKFKRRRTKVKHK